jgi:hypothetical protein
VNLGKLAAHLNTKNQTEIYPNFITKC